MDLVLKPGVIAFVACLLLVASLAEAFERPDGEPATVAIDDAASPTPEASPSTAASPTPRGSATPSATETATDGATDAATDGATPSATETTGTSGDGPTPTTDPSQPQPTPTAGEPSPAPSTSTPPSEPPPPVGPREATLYDDDAKTVGITDDRISLCGHAALSLAAAFNTSPDDLNVYWEMVADQGGIHGRTVDVEWKDDAYSGDTAVTAAENCKSENPFFIMGGIGFDQIPQVRAWAEQNQMLYLHHIAVAPSATPTYSFSLSPTVQAMGEQFGRHIAGQYADRNVGIIWRDSENWRPGRDAGRAVLDAAGVAVVGDHGVGNNQGVYTQQLNDLRTKGADVVWVWENALNAAQIINQASSQGYRPTWVVFPFQTTLDVLSGRDQLQIDGVSSWPSYVEGGYGGAFPEYGFDAEIAAFEQAYATYRPGVEPNDLLWQVWVGNKVLHRMLSDCGPDCNRNRFAGMMLDGYRMQVNPACPVDFADSRSVGNHIGGWRFFSMRSFLHGNNQLAFETTRYCVTSLG